MAELSKAFIASLRIAGIQDVERAVASLQAIKDTIEDLDKRRKPIDVGTKQYNELSSALARVKSLQQSLQSQDKALQKSLSESPKQAVGYYNELNQKLIRLRQQFKSLSEADLKSGFGQRLIGEIVQIDAKLKNLDASIGQFQRNVGNYKGALLSVFQDINPAAANFLQTLSQLTQISKGSTGGIGGLSTGVSRLAGGLGAAALALGLVGAELFKINAPISDLKADVRKTTGLLREESDELVESLKKLDTRTSLEGLLNISVVAGRLGISGKENVFEFTKAIDALNVALGDEFKGGTEEITDTVGRLSNILFGATTNGKELSDNLLFLGNALNVAANSGIATADVVADIGSRIAGVGKVFGLTNGQILGLSTTLQELGIDAERAGTATVRIITGLTQRRADFARVLGLDLKDLTNLINTDVFAAFNLVVARIAELGKTTSETSDILKELGIDGFGELEVFTKLSAETDRLNENVDKLTKSLKSQDSVLKEQAEKTDTLQGSWERLKNSFRETLVITEAENALKSLLDFASGFLNGDFAPIKIIDDGSAQEFRNIRKAREDTEKFIKRQKDFNVQENERLAKNFRGKYGLLPQEEQDLFDNEGIDAFINARKSTTQETLASIGKNKPLTPQEAEKRKQAAAEQKQRRKEIQKDVESAEKQLSEALEKILKDRRDLELKIEEETEKAKSQVFDSAYEKEVNRENLRFAEQIKEINDQKAELLAAAKQNADELDKIETLSEKDKQEKKAIIIAEAQSAIIENEQRTNTLIEALSRVHRQNLENIDKEYLEKTQKRLRDANEERFKLIQNEAELRELSIQRSKTQALSNLAQDVLAEKAKAVQTLPKAKAVRRINEIDKLAQAQELKIERTALEQTRASKQGQLAALSIPILGSLINIPESEKEKLLRDIEAINAKIQEVNEKSNKADLDSFLVTQDEKENRRQKWIELATQSAKDISDGIINLAQVENDRQEAFLIRRLEKERAAKIKQARGNKRDEEKINAEYDEKRKEVEIEAVKKNAELSRLQAVLNGALAITNIWANMKDPSLPQGFKIAGSIVAAAVTGIQIATINKQAEAQIEAIKGEEGLVIPSKKGNYRLGHDIQGDRHSAPSGGELAYVNGTPILGEAGERFERDEHGNHYVITRGATQDPHLRSILDSMRGRYFTGKGVMLDAVNRLGGGRPLIAAQGAIIPSRSERATRNSITASMSSSDMAYFAAMTAQYIRDGAYMGVSEALQDDKRISERENAAVVRSTL